jgi:hypothetical protein
LDQDLHKGQILHQDDYEVELERPLGRLAFWQPSEPPANHHDSYAKVTAILVAIDYTLGSPLIETIYFDKDLRANDD